jgi:hypothetical protein
MTHFRRFLTNISPIKCLITMSIWSIYNSTLSIKSKNILLLKRGHTRMIKTILYTNIHFQQMMFDQFPFHVYVEKVSDVQHHDRHQVHHGLIHPKVSIYQHRHYPLPQPFKNRKLKTILCLF